MKRVKSPQQIKNMNTTNQNNNVTAAPSVTIAPRNPAKGVLLFVVTLTEFFVRDCVPSYSST